MLCVTDIRRIHGVCVELTELKRCAVQLLWIKVIDPVVVDQYWMFFVVVFVVFCLFLTCVSHLLDWMCCCCLLLFVVVCCCCSVCFLTFVSHLLWHSFLFGWSPTPVQKRFKCVVPWCYGIKNWISDGAFGDCVFIVGCIVEKCDGEIHELVGMTRKNEQIGI